MKDVQNQYFQDHHILPKLKLFKISSLKITMASQSGNYKNSLYSTIMPSQSGKYHKPVFSRLPHPPKEKLSKISDYKSDTSLQSKMIENQSS